jgi:putative FmdB family regulatory protein
MRNFHQSLGDPKILYYYECKAGHHFEVEQSMKDDSLKKCVLCKKDCHRIIFPPAIALKGSGWAKDGYSSVGGKKSGEDK